MKKAPYNSHGSPRQKRSANLLYCARMPLITFSIEHNFLPTTIVIWVHTSGSRKARMIVERQEGKRGSSKQTKLVFYAYRMFHQMRIVFHGPRNIFFCSLLAFFFAIVRKMFDFLFKQVRFTNTFSTITYKVSTQRRSEIFC
jgi:hypothetical protein